MSNEPGHKKKTNQKSEKHMIHESRVTENKKIWYLNLMDLSYQEAVNALLDKYGPVQDDYFREKSYGRFLRGEIKTITKGKASRTDKGLYVHHFWENTYLNLGDTWFIRENKPPFDYQRAENLVFCDAFEHLILHALISKETGAKLGFPGYHNYLYPMCDNWYLEENPPRGKQWMMNCYSKAFLSPIQARQVLKKADELIPEKQRIQMLNYRKAQKDYIKQNNDWSKKFIRRIHKENKRKYNSIKTSIESITKDNKSITRKEVIDDLYFVKYRFNFEQKQGKDNVSEKQFTHDLLKYRKDELIEELSKFFKEGKIHKNEKR